jgi:arabinogalactan endo-1,4-beta-galactosidase
MFKTNFQMKFIVPIFFMLFFSKAVVAQTFYYGTDLSYVNEMEDCGVVYKENGTAKDVYQIFKDYNANLIRLRLWHTPSWYDTLNNGNRYSDLLDVKKSIQRAKAKGFDVLLDFHLSDNWADPSKQIIPAAWSSVVDSLSILKDSLYHYIYNTFTDLHQNNLLPKIIQIGNETNRGILLSEAVNNAGWTLDWNRNALLFNEAIRAVEDFETAFNQSIDIALHLSDPPSVDWYISNFISNGVTNFDIIGISYYHEWHSNTSISQLGNIIANLKQTYNKEVMIFETGYPWTSSFNDNANNILNTIIPSQTAPSPFNQKQWLIDLAQTVKNSGGKGVIYWEPAWVSSSCSTPWAQGSHSLDE